LAIPGADFLAGGLTLMSLTVFAGAIGAWRVRALTIIEGFDVGTSGKMTSTNRRPRRMQPKSPKT